MYRNAFAIVLGICGGCPFATNHVQSHLGARALALGQVVAPLIDAHLLIFTNSVNLAIFTLLVNHSMGCAALEVLFANSAQQKRLGSDKARRREFGEQVAKKIGQRLNELHAAPNLEALRNAPGNYHELRENRTGQVAVSVTGSLRLVFEPADDPTPAKPGGGLDWPKVTRVRIREVTDYRG